ncbi:MAG TPA: TIGR02206 family membrane protein, partial [Vicinamibacteria bacterium]|nr:TIGR02206 family membrane protein [Vicinamibacteria bacterium]
LNWLLALLGLLRLERRVAEPLYFFALAGTLPGILTPELPVGFPSVRFLAYFSTHGLVVISASVLTFGFGLLPARGAPWRAFLLLNLYALLVTPVNLALGTNFLYLRAKPASGTPFDWFGPWPYYILGLEVAFLGVFLLLDRTHQLARTPVRASTGVVRDVIVGPRQRRRS